MAAVITDILANKQVLMPNLIFSIVVSLLLYYYN